MASCNKCSMMLQPVWACCSRTCCRLFEHVVAVHVAAFLSMLQPDMLPPFRAYSSRKCCRLFDHFAAWVEYDVARIIFSSLLVQTSHCAAQAPSDQRHFQVQCRPLYCRKVQERITRYLQVQLVHLLCNNVQKHQRVLFSGHIQVQLRPLCCRHIQEVHMPL